MQIFRRILELIHKVIFSLHILMYLNFINCDILAAYLMCGTIN